jgi:hypothetical protein
MHTPTLTLLSAIATASLLTLTLAEFGSSFGSILLLDGNERVTGVYCASAKSCVVATNKEILMQLHEKGIAVPSYTTLHGQYCLRIAIANHRSVQADFDLLAKEVVRLGNEITRQEHLEFSND